MPAVRGVNLRSGDLNEEYGLFLLRLLGAVAPVPRTEDVGVDAFLTLLHNEGALYRAGRTCMIQLKSHSRGVSVVYYDAKTNGRRDVRRETDWLRSLDYPLFFGRVRRGASLDIYSSQHLLVWFLNNPEGNGVGVCFEERRQVLEPTDGKVPVVWLGPPVVSIDLGRGADDQAIRQCVDLLDEWVGILQQNLVLAPLGMLLQLRWNAEESPERVQYTQLDREPDEQQAERVFREVALRLAALTVDRLYHGEESDLEHLVGLFDLVTRDFPTFTYSKQHAQWLRDNIEHLREHRRAYRLARQRHLQQNENQ